MSWQSISVGITNAIAADTGSGGLRNASAPLITAAYNTMGPETPTLPYIVFSMVSQVERSSFTAGGVIEFIVQFDIYADKNVATTNLYAIAARLKAVLHRVSPTTSVSGFTCRQMVRSGGLAPEIDDQVIRLVEEYRATVVL